MQEPNTNRIISVTGGTRSGKSSWAEALLQDQEHITYIATMKKDPSDEDLAERILKHQERRPSHWKLLESSNTLIDDFILINPHRSILLESLGGFVTNNLHLQCKEWNILADKLLTIICSYKGTIVVVIEEVGMSLVPSSNIGRLFSDRLGILSQKLSSKAHDHWLVVQGRAIDLTSISIQVP